MTTEERSNHNKMHDVFISLIETVIIFKLVHSKISEGKVTNECVLIHAYYMKAISKLLLLCLYHSYVMKKKGENTATLLC